MIASLIPVDSLSLGRYSYTSQESLTLAVEDGKLPCSCFGHRRLRATLSRTLRESSTLSTELRAVRGVSFDSTGEFVFW